MKNSSCNLETHSSHLIIFFEILYFSNNQIQFSGIGKRKKCSNKKESFHECLFSILSQNTLLYYSKRN